MGLRELALISLAGCADPVSVEFDKTSTTPDCEYAGVNTDVDADLAEGAAQGLTENETDNELLEAYGAEVAVRLQVTLTDEGYYVGGTIEDADGNTTSYYCMSNEGETCKADVYTACEGQEAKWNIDFNSPVQEVSCDWVLPEGAETPEDLPDCTLNEEGDSLSVDAE